MALSESVLIYVIAKRLQRVSRISGESPAEANSLSDFQDQLQIATDCLLIPILAAESSTPRTQPASHSTRMAVYFTWCCGNNPQKVQLPHKSGCGQHHHPHTRFSLHNALYSRTVNRYRGLSALGGYSYSASRSAVQDHIRMM